MTNPIINVVVGAKPVTVKVSNPNVVVVNDPDIRVVQVGTQGPAGPAGPGSGAASAICGETISTYQVVALVNGELFKADYTNMAHAGRVVGVSTQSGTAGSTITYVSNGEVLGGTFVQGTRYFAGTAGGLTSTVPTSGWLQQIGIAESNSELVVQLGQVVKRS